MNTQIAQYSNEIADVAAFAAKIGFDVNNGNWDELMFKWIEFGRKRHNAILDNKEQAIKILKSI